MIMELVLLICLLAFMFGLGLGLTPLDFKRVATEPKPVVIGLTCQLVMLPLIGLLIAWAFYQGNLTFFLGLFILVLCPGGSTSNLFADLCKADVPLSFTLTALSSLVSPFVLAIVLNAFFSDMLAGSAGLSAMLSTTMKILTISLLPMLLGMFVRARYPKARLALEASIKKIAVVLLVIAIVGIGYQNSGQIVPSFSLYGVPCAILLASTMSLAWFTGKAGGLKYKQRMAIVAEVGIQNGAMAMTIASHEQFFGQKELAFGPMVYSLMMYMAMGIVIAISRFSPNKSSSVTATLENP